MIINVSHVAELSEFQEFISSLTESVQKKLKTVSFPCFHPHPPIEALESDPITTPPSKVAARMVVWGGREGIQHHRYTDSSELPSHSRLLSAQWIMGLGVLCMNNFRVNLCCFIRNTGQSFFSLSWNNTISYTCIVSKHVNCSLDVTSRCFTLRFS